MTTGFSLSSSIIRAVGGGSLGAGDRSPLLPPGPLSKLSLSAAAMTKKPTIVVPRDLNQRTFQRLRRRMAKTHAGQWVALMDGKVVAITRSLEQLRGELESIGANPEHTMVFQAGEAWPLWGKRIQILPFKW